LVELLHDYSSARDELAEGRAFDIRLSLGRRGAGGDGYTERGRRRRGAVRAGRGRPAGGRFRGDPGRDGQPAHGADLLSVHALGLLQAPLGGGEMVHYPVRGAVRHFLLGAVAEFAAPVSAKLGGGAMGDYAYMRARDLNSFWGGVQICTLLFALVISVLKPWRKAPEAVR